MRTAVVVPAAGRGERLGPGEPKAQRMLRGEPLLVHAVRSLLAAPCVDLVVVVAPPGSSSAVRDQITPVVGARGLLVVAGGDTRTASVAAGLAALPDDVDIVLVHDAARPLVPAAVVGAVVDAVRSGHPAVVPVVPVADTVKAVDGDGQVTATVDRTALRLVQTPQGFRRDVLVAAYAAGAATAATDDAGLVERLGGPVHTVAGDPLAFKVTGPLDLVLAEAVLAAGLAVPADAGVR